MVLEKIIEKERLKIPKKFLPLAVAGALAFNSCAKITPYTDVRKIPYKKEIVTRNYGDYEIKAEQKEDKLYVYLNKISKKKTLEANLVKEVYIEGKKIEKEPTMFWIFLGTTFVLVPLTIASFSSNNKTLFIVGCITLAPAISAFGGTIALGEMGPDVEYKEKTVGEKIKLVGETPISDKVIGKFPISGKVSFYYPPDIEVRPNPLYIKKGKGVASLNVKDGVILYDDFLKKPEVSMFKGMCDLKKAYDGLKTIYRKITLSYKDYKKNISIKIKSLEENSLIPALKKAGCM